MDDSSGHSMTVDAPVHAPVDQNTTPSTPTPQKGHFEPQMAEALSSESISNMHASHGDVAGSNPLPPQDEDMTPGFAPTQSPSSEAIVSRDATPQSIPLAKDGEQQDVEMGDADDMNNADGGDDGSEDESVTSESQKPSKKKKGQRFFCTEFPPCQLSFTRSEHLARHIRKHTGERPFQCHCSRRFSRLDNLRQHAQTVHVNEDIPLDSLAAQSTRFQRQIRTDRVRPAGSRSRASTLSSHAPHSRGHSRNLSTSSIGSNASSVGMSEDSPLRPPPLAMANDPSARARLSLETFNPTGSNSNQHYGYYNQSPTGYSTPTGLSTPTSTTFSTETGSPQYQSGMVSPVSTLSRSSFYPGGHPPSRRLSVPSVSYPYQPQGAATYPLPYFSPGQPSSPGIFSQNSSVFASPTSSVFSHSRRDSDAEMDHRRRTWHPSTNSQFMQRPATSGLTYHQTPDEPRPAFSQQPAASQLTRLPGIESFDYALSPVARPPSSPMAAEVSPQPPRSAHMSDSGPSQGLARLDIATANSSDGAWHAQSPNPPGGYRYPPGSAQTPTYGPPQQTTMPESPVTPRNKKRNAWYGGPLESHQLPQPHQSVLRTSPEDSGSSDGVPTPAMSQGSGSHQVTVHPSPAAEFYPTGSSIAGEQKVPLRNQSRNGNQFQADSSLQSFVRSDDLQQQQQHAPQQISSTSAPHTYALQSGHDARFAQTNRELTAPNDMTKLEALVAVATSENRAVTHGT